MTLPEADWKFVENSVPILCVDVLPWFRTPDGPRVGLIRRASEKGDELSWNLVGGRVRLDETLAAAVERHMHETLGPTVSWTRSEFSHPEEVEQYLRRPSHGFGHDPRHHAVALSYVMECAGEFEAGGEAVDFQLFAPTRFPAVEDIGFSQGRVVHALLQAVPSS